MEQNINKKPYNVIAAILFGLYALYQFINFIRVLTYGRFSLLSVLMLAACGLVAYCLYSEKKDYLLLAGVAALFVLNIYQFLIGFKYGYYRTYDYYDGYRFSFMLFLLGFIKVIGYAGATAIVLAYTTEYIDVYKKYVKKLWFVPSLCILVSTVFSLGGNALIYIMGYKRTTGIFSTLLAIGLAVGFFLMAMWLVQPEGISQKKESNVGMGTSSTAGTNSISTEPIYYSLVTHILLLLFTCGVWLYIWIYRMTRYLNCVEDEEYRNPTNKLLLCMFVPFYSIYWTYKSAMRIDKLAKMKGMPSDLSTLCLILAIFVPIIPPILMQDKVNAIVSSSAPVQPTANVQAAQYVQPTPVQSQPVQSVVDETELLKKYKDLLDTGVITQEEFDAKKKQILGL